MSTKTLGDPHLGRKFEAGVPLHRRGDREKMQQADFMASLFDVTDYEIHVNMGDIFDKSHVSYAVIMWAFNTYIAAATQNPHCLYLIIMGNHDAGKDVERVTAFRVFASLIEGRLPNLRVVEHQPLRVRDEVFIPWHPVLTAEEMVLQNSHLIKDAAVAYGHWDVLDFGGTNMIPARHLLRYGVQRAVTGHDHHARHIDYDHLPIEVTGSMQPYTHGEAQDEKLYVTRPLADVRTGDWKDKCLRVLLDQGEQLDFQVDCLQLVTKRVGVEVEEAQAVVEFEAFDMDTLFTRAFEEAGVSATVTDSFRQRLEAERVRSQD